MKLLWGGLSVLFAVLLAPTCRADVPSVVAEYDALPVKQRQKWEKDAKEILDKYQSDGVLRREPGMQSYLSDKAFDSLAGTEKDMEEKEYLDAALHWRPNVKDKPYWNANVIGFARLEENGPEYPVPDENEEKKRFALDEQAAGGTLTAEHLLKNNPVWKERIILAARAHWRRLNRYNGRNETEEGANQTQVARYLYGEKVVPQRNSAPERRLERFQAAASGKPLTRAVYISFRTDERFIELDKDGSEALDLAEFKAGFPYQEAEREFVAAAGPDFHLSYPEYRGAATTKTTHLFVELRNSLTKEWDTRFDEPLAPDTALAQFKAEERNAKQEEEKKSPSAHGYVPGRGFLLVGKRVYKEPDQITFDDKRTTLFMQLVKNFTDMGDQAEDASIAVAGKKGTGPFAAIDAALRFQLFDKKEDRLLQTFGYEVHRTGEGDEKSDTRKVYLLLQQFLPSSRRGFVAGGSVLFGPVWGYSNGMENISVKDDPLTPVREDQIRSRVESLTGLVEWTPVLQVHARSGNRYQSGIFYPLAGLKNVEAYLQPRLAFEWNHVLHKTAGSEAHDAYYLRPDIQLGLTLFKNLTLRATYEFYRGTRSRDPDHTYREYSLTVPILKDGDEDLLSLTGTYKQGSQWPNFEAANEFTFGFGAKF
jgi:hypothetical protein